MIKNIAMVKTRYNRILVTILLVSLLSIMGVSLKEGYNKINDVFFQKSLLIKNYNRLRFVLGDQVFTPNVLMGKDEWLLYANDKNLDDYQNAIPLLEHQLNRLDKKLELTNQFGEENNIQFIIVIAPNKETIYPDKVPDIIPVINQESRFDQILKAIEAYPHIQILDVRDALRTARQIQDTYYKTDTHWNNFGAYITYTEIIKQLSQHFPELQIYPQDLLVSTKSMRVFDLSYLTGIENMSELASFLNPPIRLFESITTSSTFGYYKTTSISTLNTPSVLIYHDSFGGAINPFLSLSFEKAHFIRYEEDKYFPFNAIKDFQPDIVIVEIAERHIHFLREILPLVISQ